MKSLRISRINLWADAREGILEAHSDSDDDALRSLALHVVLDEGMRQTRYLHHAAVAALIWLLTDDTAGER